MTRFDAFQGARYFPALDGLRALSIVAVIWHHVYDPAGPWGYLGVSLFFGISGFLITTLLLRERAASGTISLRHFYLRRTLRIFPLYYAVVALYTLLVLATERDSAAGRQFLENLPYFLTYTSNWFVDLGAGERVIFYFAWTLAVEEQFYLFWPAVVRYARRAAIPVLVMVGLVLLDQTTELLAAAGRIDATLLPIRIIVSIATPICLGCLAAFAAERRRSFELLERALGRGGAAPAALLAIPAAVALGAPMLLTHLLMVLLVLSVSLRQDHPLAALLAHRVPRYVGTISYGMYLLHMLSFNLVRRLLPDDWQSKAVLFLTVLAVSIAAATISYYAFERWFLRLKDRWRRPSTTRAVPRLTLLKPDAAARGVSSAAAVLNAAPARRGVASGAAPHTPE